MGYMQRLKVAYSLGFCFFNIFLLSWTYLSISHCAAYTCIVYLPTMTS